MANEVGSLAENTQNELNTMKEFVQKVYEASQQGQKSTERAVESTEQMSGKIDYGYVGGRRGTDREHRGDYKQY